MKIFPGGTGAVSDEIRVHSKTPIPFWPSGTSKWDCWGTSKLRDYNRVFKIEGSWRGHSRGFPATDRSWSDPKSSAPPSSRLKRRSEVHWWEWNRGKERTAEDLGTITMDLIFAPHFALEICIISSLNYARRTEIDTRFVIENSIISYAVDGKRCRATNFDAHNKNLSWRSSGPLGSEIELQLTRLRNSEKLLAFSSGFETKLCQHIKPSMFDPILCPDAIKFKNIQRSWPKCTVTTNPMTMDP